ncbi:MAG: 2-C-methyl-D-erythritol 2,4-cyclodiphosphate synthase [Azoarcus sp.]|jgi:2-C-methyl-D-erythritol 2,4-cyclodiphosphate synthase|nr:2-C-methyl-D-erythritol 2,4-cyclodiphosphate synthase [Azoarcus sp.]
MKTAIRVGQGFDVHAFTEGRPLVLGGVTIPFSRGLLGHSDADVLLHAISDALLGAAGLGDIGRLFPDTDTRYKGADSRVLLRTVFAKVWEAGFEVGNIDATIICQEPKIQPYAARMAANIADDLNINLDAANVKGKTTEKLGFTGRGEGIAAQAVVLLLRRTE